MKKLLFLLLLMGAGYYAWQKYGAGISLGTPREGNGTRGIQRMTGGAKEAEQIK